MDSLDISKMDSLDISKMDSLANTSKNTDHICTKFYLYVRFYGTVFVIFGGSDSHRED